MLRESWEGADEVAEIHASTPGFEDIGLMPGLLQQSPDTAGVNAIEFDKPSAILYKLGQDAHCSP